jgi:hypothetical protein
MIVASLVLIIAAVGVYLVFLQPAVPPGAEIVIQVDGVDLHTFPLYQEGRNQQITVFGPVGETTIVMEADRVRVIDSDCPDKICVNMGWINRPGVPIACLPNRVIVSVKGDVEDGDIDLR